jgi:hypothetical protein
MPSEKEQKNVETEDKDLSAVENDWAEDSVEYSIPENLDVFYTPDSYNGNN